MNATTTIGSYCLVVMLFALILLAVPQAFAMQFDYKIELSEADLLFEEFQGYDMVKLQGSNNLSEPGKPRLPAIELRIALPDGMKAEWVRVEGLQHQELAGNYNIFPSQPPIRVSQSDDDLQFVSPDSAIYQSDQPYPVEIVKLIRQSDLAGQSIAVVEIYPLQYVPTEGLLTLYTSITIVIEGSTGYLCGDYLPANMSPRDADVYQKQLERMVVNSDDIQLHHSPTAFTKSRMLPPGGPFDHLIITTTSLAPYFSDLVFWHTRKGVHDTVITTDYIYANYSGADNPEKIRNFVIDAHNNWGTLYFLIGGENSQVPFKYRTYVSESIPSDQYYADFDDDWYSELFVGRVTASDATQTTRFVNKVLKYETDPPTVGYALNATILGMDLTTAWEPPWYTLTASEDLKEAIDVDYIPVSLNVTKVYDSDATNHRTDFLNALNAGQNLVNHSDHSSWYSMGTGDRNHGLSINSSTVDGLTNTGRMSVIFSLGCHSNELDHNDCIGEHFVIYNDLQAGVAFTGNTRSGWFYVGEPISLSGELDLNWWRGLFDHDCYRLGETLADTKNTTSHSDDHMRYCHWTLNLLGEPEMPVWTSNPKAMVVTHPDSITSVPTEFTVNVTTSHGFAIDSAFVCLYKEGEIYQRGYTDENGDAIITVTTSAIGDLYVTVTKRNYLPYLGQAGMEVTNVAPECGVPNDSTIQTRSQSEICLPVSCYDPDGNLDSGPTIVDGPGEIIDDEWCYQTGSEDTVTVTIRCEDTEGLYCESEFQIVLDLYLCGDADGNGVVEVSDASYLVAYIFTSGPAPEPLESGDADCNSIVEITDVVYLIEYIFNDGPAPCADCP